MYSINEDYSISVGERTVDIGEMYGGNLGEGDV